MTPLTYKQQGLSTTAMVAAKEAEKVRRKYTQDWRRLQGRISFPYVDLTLETSEKRIPYVHALDDDTYASPYLIRYTHTRVGDALVVEYEFPKAASPGLQLFLAALADVLAARDTVNVRAPEPLRPLDEKVNLFLRRHAQVSYAEFVAQANVPALKQNDFGLLGKAGLKYRLFDFRAKAYVAALAATVDAGHDLAQTLEEVHAAKIPPLKRERDEPTFEYLVRRLSPCA